MNKLDPKSVWIFFVSSFFKFLFMSLILGAYAFSLYVGTGATIALDHAVLGILVFIVIVVVVAFIWAKLTYHFYGYELTENGFRKESGVIRKKYATIPYDRIQNVDIQRGLFSRMLGLSDLYIQTAGGSLPQSGVAEGTLIGVSQETALKLRDEVLERSKKSRIQSNGL